MRNVSSNCLTNIGKTNEYGGSVKIFTAFYENHKYCYRVYKECFFDKMFIKRMGELTEEEFPEEYLKPMYMVDRKKGLYRNLQKMFKI